MNAFSQLVSALKPFYPDMSGLTVVSMTDRGKDYVRDYIHRNIGGLLPRCVTYSEYMQEQMEKRTGLSSLTGEDLVIRFFVFLHKLKEAVNPEEASGQLTFMKEAARFSLTHSYLRSLTRVSEERFSRIERLFEKREQFITFLAQEGYVAPELTDVAVMELEPQSTDFFVGVPLLTPANKEFFKQISSHRKFIDDLAFGMNETEIPDSIDSAALICRQFGLTAILKEREKMRFVELESAQTAPAFLKKEIHQFLETRTQDQQLYLVLLDETQSFFLWERVFRDFGEMVNTAVWFPLTLFAPGQEMYRILHREKNIPAALEDIKKRFVSTLRKEGESLAAEEKAALEAGVQCAEQFIQLASQQRDIFVEIADWILRNKKFYLHGSRHAPIQIVGFGAATGIPYEKAILFPLNTGVFPKKTAHNAYINSILTSSVSRTIFEMEDVMFRQFLAFGQSDVLISVYDAAQGLAPSYYFTFLKQEWESPVERYALSPGVARKSKEMPFLSLDDNIRNMVKGFTWSFSSLKTLFTCPFRFYHQYLAKTKIPSVMTEEESTMLMIGNVIHRFFEKTGLCADQLAVWKKNFDQIWEQDEIIGNVAGAEVYRSLAESYIKELADWEAEHEKIAFSQAEDVEKKMNSVFGVSGYKVKGIADKIIRKPDNSLLILDFKFKDKIEAAAAPLIELLDRETPYKIFDDRFQLILYTWLAEQNFIETQSAVEACYVLLKAPAERFYQYLSPEDLDKKDVILNKIGEKIDEFVRSQTWLPHYKASLCRFCGYQALCRKENLYKKEK